MGSYETNLNSTMEKYEPKDIQDMDKEKGSQPVSLLMLRVA